MVAALIIIIYYSFASQKAVNTIENILTWKLEISGMFSSGYGSECWIAFLN